MTSRWMVALSFLRTAPVFVAVIVALAIAYDAAFTPTAHGGPYQREKVKVDYHGDKEKVDCRVLDVKDMKPKRQEAWNRQWREGNGCGSQCAEHVPFRMAEGGGNKEMRIQLYQHEQGYYLDFNGQLPRGLVGTADALVLGLENDTQIELYPLCDRSTSRGASNQWEGYRGSAPASRVCGLYKISEEEVRQLGNNRLTNVRVFFLPAKDRGRGGAGAKLKATDDGRQYLEYRKTPPFSYSVTPRAYCIVRVGDMSAQ